MASQSFSFLENEMEHDWLQVLKYHITIDYKCRVDSNQRSMKISIKYWYSIAWTPQFNSPQIMMILLLTWSQDSDFNGVISFNHPIQKEENINNTLTTFF